jgi:hypothetical protein
VAPAAAPDDVTADDADAGAVVPSGGPSIPEGETDGWSAEEPRLPFG